jgi:sugar phosphate isomerase/epimerase
MITMPNKMAARLFFLLAVLSICLSCGDTAATKEAAAAGSTKDAIIFSVNAYSFSDLLSAKDFRDEEQVYTLFNLLEWCHDRGIKGLDPTAYFFPTYPEVPSDDYLKIFRERAAEYGIVITGTGIRNDFANPDPGIRAEGVARAKEWIVAASKLGAPVLRCFAGEIPEGYKDNWEEPAGWMIECYKELIPLAAEHGVKIGIQNHGDMLQTAAQCLYILEKIDSPWAGIIIDTGNFTTADPYKDIEQLVPYAVNWQVKEFTDGYGGHIRTDYEKLVRIIVKGGYEGFVPVETLKVGGESYDPFARVIQMLADLNAQLALNP